MNNKKTAIINGNVFFDNTFIKKDILICDDKIDAIDNFEITEDTEVFDAKNNFVLPGFFDEHTHGGALIDFNHIKENEIDTVCNFFAKHGVTSFFPTILTDNIETMKEKLDILSNPKILENYPQIRGIHLEGPFLCKQYKGAMPEEFLQKCDYKLFEELQKAARNKIKLITLSPELDNAIDLIKKLTKLGVKVSIGHSAASYEDAMAGIKAGATSATHVMNAMKLLHMHDPAILTAVLESDIYAEMICDGFHLHPPIIRFLLKAKGISKMIAITDSIMAAGCKDGQYVLGANNVTVKDGDAKLTETGVRAGSTLTMDMALRNIIKFTNLPLEKVIPLVSENALKMNEMFSSTGSIAPKKFADIIVLNNNMIPVATYSKGKKVY